VLVHKGAFKNIVFQSALIIIKIPREAPPSDRLAISGAAGIADTTAGTPPRRVFFAPLFGHAKSGKRAT
jgi:hypothetical protein